ncbi:hypothetical protein DEO72_LG9g1168 [Vigna unguiculata]|uniref:Uncharacterized protein n=1 Tax=Vigna unguiculata TaxID=3917 RepID=A0A4D6N2D4_VIGUN|nr:hypothetical protein DEO72_LG9g1168 [Vigna unguiculata]
MDTPSSSSADPILLNSSISLPNKINGHFIWDADPGMCDPDCDCHHDYGDSSDEEEEEDDGKPGGGPCKPSPPPYDRSPPADRPWIGLHQQNLPDPFWKQRRCLEILGRYHSPPRIPVPCMMFTETNYESEFPSLERQVDPVSNIATKPNISPTEVGPEGRLKPLTQAEEVLNWHTENAKAQNNILKRIDAGVSRLSTHIEETDGRILHLSERMQKHYHHLSLEISRLEKEWKTTSFGKASDQKEREIRSLKNESLHDINKEEEQGNPFLDILMANTSSSRQEPIYESPEEEEVSSFPPRGDNQRPISGPWFTLDDITPDQWRKRLIDYRQQLVRHLKEIRQEENHNEIQLTPSRMIPSGQQGLTTTEFYIPEGQFQISQDLGGPEEDKEDFDSWDPAGQKDDIMDSDTDPNLSPSHEPIFKD